MKKFAAFAIVSLPIALMSSTYAQSTNSTAAPNAPASSSSTTTTTTPSGTPSGPGNNRSADGNANAPATSAAAPGNGALGTAPASGTSGTAGTTGAMPATSADSSAMADAISGWSVKDKLMGKSVYNENDQKVGDISDIVLSTDGKTAYFVVGVGGFIGMGERKVAIPFDKVTPADDKLVLQGYTKDQLKAMPEFKLAK